MLKLNELYLMDCMEGMKQIPDKYFELCITDPPYGIGANRMTLGNGKRVLHRGGIGTSRHRARSILMSCFG